MIFITNESALHKLNHRPVTHVRITYRHYIRHRLYFWRTPRRHLADFWLNITEPRDTVFVRAASKYTTTKYMATKYKLCYTKRSKHSTIQTYMICVNMARINKLDGPIDQKTKQPKMLLSISTSIILICCVTKCYIYSFI